MKELNEGIAYFEFLSDSYKNLFANKKVDVVIIGGGPVGLWTAIQLKTKDPNVDIQILERYEEYKRNQTLQLDLTTITNAEVKAQLLEIAKENGLKLKNDSLSIPIQLLESCFSEQAKKLGIKVKKNVAFVTSHAVPEEKRTPNRETLTLAEVAETFPNAKVIIGADGSHSTVREAHFGPEDEVVKRKTVQYLVEFKYQAQVDVNKKPYKLPSHFATEKLAGFRCIETVKVDPDTGVANITLRFIVDKKTYESLGEASFKKPVTDLTTLPEKIQHAINVWVNARTMENGDVVIPDADKRVSKIPLDIYKCKAFAKPFQDDRIVFLVGDAAFGVPYFRALNAGLVCADKLSDLLKNAYLLDSGITASTFPGLTEHHTSQMNDKYKSEKILAMGKDFLFDLSKAFVIKFKTGPLETNKWRGEKRKELKEPHSMFASHSSDAHDEKSAVVMHTGSGSASGSGLFSSSEFKTLTQTSGEPTCKFFPDDVPLKTKTALGKTLTELKEKHDEIKRKINPPSDYPTHMKKHLSDKDFAQISLIISVLELKKGISESKIADAKLKLKQYAPYAGRQKITSGKADFIVAYAEAMLRPAETNAPAQSAPTPPRAASRGSSPPHS